MSASIDHQMLEELRADVKHIRRQLFETGNGKPSLSERVGLLEQQDRHTERGFRTRDRIAWDVFVVVLTAGIMVLAQVLILGG